MSEKSEPLRVAVIGVHGMGVGHLWAAKSDDAAVLVAACDAVPERAEKAATDLGVEAFTSTAEMFASGTVDAVVICTPPGTHGALVGQALDAGLHVYCEKPFTPTAGEGHDLGARADRAGLVVQVGFQFRFQRSRQAAQQLVDDGAVGAVYRADLTATNWFRPHSYFDEARWRGEWAGSGGGVLTSQAVHQLDALITLMGLPARVTARAWRGRHPVAVEDDVLALLEWENGARGSLAASIADPVGTDRVELHGEHATLRLEGFDLWQARLPQPASELLADPAAGSFDRVEVEWEQLVSGSEEKEWFRMLQDCHANFYAAVAGTAATVCPPRDAARTTAAANAIYLSAARGQSVELPANDAEYEALFAELCSGSFSFPTRPGGGA